MLDVLQAIWLNFLQKQTHIINTPVHSPAVCFYFYILHFQQSIMFVLQPSNDGSSPSRVLYWSDGQIKDILKTLLEPHIVTRLWDECWPAVQSTTHVARVERQNTRHDVFNQTKDMTERRRGMLSSSSFNDCLMQPTEPGCAAKMRLFLFVAATRINEQILIYFVQFYCPVVNIL